MAINGTLDQQTGKVLLAAPWADCLYAADREWWKATRNAEGFRGGLKVTVGEDYVFPDVKRMRTENGYHLSADPGVLAKGKHGGHQAINLAVHAIGPGGRILLLGYDCRRGPGHRSHWHGDHPSPLRNPGRDTLKRWAETLDGLPPHLAAAGVELIDCTPGGALTAFPKLPIEEILR